MVSLRWVRLSNSHEGHLFSRRFCLVIERVLSPTYIKSKFLFAGFINDLLHVADASGTDNEPFDLSNHASQSEILEVASGPCLTQAHGLLIGRGLGLTHLTAGSA